MIGLLVLVLIGWFVQGAVTGEAGSGSMPPPGEPAVVSPAGWAAEHELPEQIFDY